MKYGKSEKWIKFLVYLAVIVLVNMVSGTLFFRIDLTANKTYSLSPASKALVSSLEEPLTVRVFLSANLPKPYNNLEQQVRDLMEEYALAGNKNFNYSLYIMDKDGTATDKNGQNLRKMAQDYNIPSIQIQNVEQDQVKLQSAYMGMVLIQGDLVETIPALANETNLEYRITSIINKISRKTSTMLAMKDNVKIKLLLSPQLVGLSKSFTSYGDDLKAMVNKMNSENFGRLEFSEVDPTRLPESELKSYGLNTINLQSGSKDNPIVTKAWAGVVVSYGNNTTAINLLNRGLFGGYSLTAVKDLKQWIGDSTEKMIGVNQSIGYLSDHGTMALYSNPYAQQQAPSAGNFNKLLSGDYNVEGVTLDNIPGDVKTLIINGPKEKFTDWELFELDQFIMKGGSVAFFKDAYNQIMPSQQAMMYGQMPQYKPLDTGLEKLLEHYGVKEEQSYVMDEKCYVQQQQDSNGGVVQTPIYFAPKISMENIDNSLPFMKNIKGLIALDISPLTTTLAKDSPVKATTLFSSSKSAWTVSKNINLYNPRTITPPAKDERSSSKLAILLEGPLTSYFKGKDIPARPQPSDKDKKDAKKTDNKEITLSGDNMSAQTGFVSSTENGKIFVAGGSAILGDNLLDASGSAPNAMFVQNIIDYLNGRTDYAIMRSKGQGYNPLADVTSRTKAFLKGLNIIVLPILVILAGIVVWFRWNGRRKRIAQMFE